MKIRFTGEDIRDPLMSEQVMVREESAAHCDGLECGKYCEDENGDPMEPGPHYHLVVYGVNPPTSRRVTPIFSNWTTVVYEGDRQL